MPALKILVSPDDLIRLIRHIGAQYFGCNRGMILDRDYLADIMTERGDDQLFAGAVPHCSGGSLQSMLQLIYCEPVNLLLQLLYQPDYDCGHAGLPVHY